MLDRAEKKEKDLVIPLKNVNIRQGSQAMKDNKEKKNGQEKKVTEE